MRLLKYLLAISFLTFNACSYSQSLKLSLKTSVTSKKFFKLTVTEMLSTYEGVRLLPNTLEEPIMAISFNEGLKRLRVKFMHEGERSGLKKDWLDIEYYKNIPIGV